MFKGRVNFVILHNCNAADSLVPCVCRMYDVASAVSAAPGYMAVLEMITGINSKWGAFNKISQGIENYDSFQT